MSFWLKFLEQWVINIDREEEKACEPESFPFSSKYLCLYNKNIFSPLKSYLTYSQRKLSVDFMLSTDCSKFIFALFCLEEWAYF